MQTQVLHTSEGLVPATGAEVVTPVQRETQTWRRKPTMSAADLQAEHTKGAPTVLTLPLPTPSPSHSHGTSVSLGN